MVHATTAMVLSAIRVTLNMMKAVRELLLISSILRMRILMSS
jgi:hypothetical protein